MPEYTGENHNNKKTYYTKTDRLHILLVVVMAIVALVLFVKCFSLFNSDPQIPEGSSISQSTTVTTTQSTTAPSTTAPTTNSTKPTESKPQNQTEPSTKAPENGESKEEILKKVADGINALKAPDANYYAHKNQYIDIKLTDCSVPQVMSLINGVLERFMGQEEFDYDFVNGVADDPDEGGQITTDKAIPPSLKPFGLTIDGVENAWVEKDGENTVYTITVVPEESTMDSKPKYHDVACDVIALESLNIPAKITRADYKYSGTKISVTYNPQGQVIRYHEYFDMYGVGEGGAMGITATCVMEGYIDETWDIQWK